MAKYDILEQFSVGLKVQEKLNRRMDMDDEKEKMRK